MSERPAESWRLRASVSEALDVFNSTHMQETWARALARRESDPPGAVTSARTLLESVCKHILEAADQPYKDGIPLQQLYKLAAGVLHLAPDEHTAPIFTSLFEACAEVIESIGRLRNHLSDSHGRGPFGTMPDWRHAELAVNLSGAMATYLAAVWAGRQPTVATVIGEFLRNNEVGTSHRYTLKMLMESRIGRAIASKLQQGDLIEHCEYRIAAGAQPATITQDITYLKGALGDLSSSVVDKTIPILRSRNLIGRKYVPRKRRITHDEYDALINLFREPPKKNSEKVIPMVDIMEFAVWSGRSISEICSLRWSDVDFQKRTCKLPGAKEDFPLLEKAWDVVAARTRKNPSDPKERIFPYYHKSVGAKHTRAKAVLRQRVGEDLRFQDLTYEAASRLLEKGHPVHEVSRATGQNIRKVMQIFEEMQSSAAGASQSADSRS